MLAIIVGAQFYCGMSSITSASRMMYAFSRDGAVPGHQLWRRLNAQRVPYMAAIAIAVLAFLCAFPAYFGTNGAVAYAAVTSIATIGLYIAYAIPIFLRLRARRRLGAGRVEPRQALPLDRHRSRAYGSCFIAILFMAPLSPAGIPWNSNFTWLVGQLRTDRGARHAAARRRLVDALGEQVVQGPGRAGHARGAGADRSAVRARRPRGAAPSSA